VNQGTLLGYSGTTGDSTGCHLHFEVYVNGATVNPRPLLGL
jgi:murein DD-endopeptidase MepM/ murein hydrolase activator NlpD